MDSIYNSRIDAYKNSSALEKLCTDILTLIFINSEKKAKLALTCCSFILKKQITEIKKNQKFNEFKFFNIGLKTKDKYGNSLKKYVDLASDYNCNVFLSIGPGCDLLILYEIIDRIHHIEQLDLSKCKTDTLLGKGFSSYGENFHLQIINTLYAGKNMKQVFLPPDFPVDKLNPIYSEVYYTPQNENLIQNRSQSRVLKEISNIIKKITKF